MLNQFNMIFHDPYWALIGCKKMLNKLWILFHALEFQKLLSHDIRYAFVFNLKSLFSTIEQSKFSVGKYSFYDPSIQFIITYTNNILIILWFIYDY